MRERELTEPLFNKILQSRSPPHSLLLKSRHFASSVGFTNQPAPLQHVMVCELFPVKPGNFENTLLKTVTLQLAAGYTFPGGRGFQLASLIPSGIPMSHLWSGLNGLEMEEIQQFPAKL